MVYVRIVGAKWLSQNDENERKQHNERESVREKLKLDK